MCSDCRIGTIHLSSNGAGLALGEKRPGRPGRLTGGPVDELKVLKSELNPKLADARFQKPR
jgi:hypothetical protein